MKKISVGAFVAVAALALGICGQQARAEPPGTIHARSFPLAATPDLNPNAKEPAMTMGVVAFGTYPPTDSSGNSEWPCFTGGSDPNCSTIPAGGVILGVPYQDWSVSACNVGPGAACGQIYWSFTSNHASGTVMVSETITQGTKTIYQSGTTNLGMGTAPFQSWVWDEIGMGPNACSGCVAVVKGPARITVTATVGSVTVTGHAPLIMQ